MSWQRYFGRLIGAFRTDTERERELHDEMRAHIEHETDEGIERGLDAEEARRQAMLRFGNLQQAHDDARSEWSLPSLESVVADVRYCRRVLAKAPTYSVAMVLTLALAIGASTTMFGVIYGLYSRALPYPDAERVAVVHMSFAPQNNPRGNMSLADFADWREANKAFESVAAYSVTRSVLGGERAEEVAGANVTAQFFSVLQRSAVRGRLFEPGDDAAGAPNEVVISAKLWREHFASDPAIVGRIVEVNGAPASVIGVVADAGPFPRPDLQLWSNARLRFTRRGPFFYHGIGRLRPGISLAQAQAETDAIGARIERANARQYFGLRMPVEPLRQFMLGDARQITYPAIGAVIVVFIIALVNVANLLLSRTITRQREMALRASLGADRARLMQQLLVECAMLALIGCGSGLGGAALALEALRRWNPMHMALATQLQVDWHVIVFASFVALIAALAFGIVPALQATAQMESAVREASRTQTTSARAMRLRAMFVVAEIALSLMLLVSAGLLLRSLARLERANTGANTAPEDLLAVEVVPKRIADRTAAEAEALRFYSRAVDALRALPGAESVAVADSIPPNIYGEDDTFHIAGREWTESEFPSTIQPKIGAQYFHALGVPLVRGRFFNESDTASSEPVCIINESLARRYFPGADPIGQKIGASGPGNQDPYMTVVGVVGDVKYGGMQNEARPALYEMYEQASVGASYVIIRARNAASLAPVVQQRLREVDREAVIRRVVTLQDLMDDAVAQPRLRSMVTGSLSCVTLLMAALGLYGVIAYSVTQRRQEIGIRVAVGATRGTIVGMIARGGAKLAAIGIAIGLLSAALVSRAFTPLLYGVAWWDLATYAASAAMLLAVALIASVAPAVRAMRSDPLQVIRCD